MTLKELTVTEMPASPAIRRTSFWPRPRFWNVAFRTAHIAVSAALFGGHMFDAPAQRLLAWLYAAIFTGGVLAVIEAYPSVSWCYEVRGLCVLTKLALLCCIPWLWEYRVAILVVVIVIASVGSHIPRRFRHFSIVHGRELRDAP